MKKLIVICLVLLLLGGGGAGYYLFFMKKPVAQPVAVALSEPAPLLAMAPFKVPLVREGRISRYGQIQISLELRGEEELKAATAFETRLRDAILLDLQHQALNTTGDQPQMDLAAFRRRVRMIANRVLKGDLVSEVLVVHWFDPRQS
ncbi:MAG: flagellar basal body-associated FliL family protein [Alphaproteobacteria bacterium]|nr:flagellar basal body-associated FliL family protein [Alphaproteobacteria bacterium]